MMLYLLIIYIVLLSSARFLKSSLVGTRHFAERHLGRLAKARSEVPLLNEFARR